MAKWYVGQRVKFVRAMTARPPRLPIGSEGVIVNFRAFQKGTVCRDGSILPVNTDCSALMNGDVWHFAFVHLEPIIPEGSKNVVSWDECPFDREGKYKELVHEHVH